MTYIVQPGDTLWAIAARFGTTPQAIMQANGLTDPNLLYVGQRLIIPVSTPTPTPYPPQPRDLIRRVERLERRVERLEHRVERLERPRTRTEEKE
ncbi:MAG: LysM peptidoglycan-binding domain-containing protein [Tepidibacillus sp.]|uniref:LysM peptidoglycan-binding domain-containing protein n=1 Tax=Tepidibacillus sp. HK-1 TaxID=1883407 RepID=UPI000852BFB1|nr:LysM domain-containing protein [Tepidibacillus sp. HK-1]GBF10865.1 putative cell wall hydrolase LytN precursor [Tepidibacillus sp. HK-1]